MSDVVLITGASSGLGLATALSMHQKGYTVFGTSRNPEIHQEQHPFKFLYLENSDSKSIQSCIKSVLNETNRLDILINNAGVGITGPMEEIELDQVKNHFEINCFGPLRLMQAVMPLMRNQGGGVIINVTSIAADMGLPFRGVYSAAKSALERMTESLRLESHAFGIKICNLAPGDFISNIAERRHYTPLNKNSPYFENYQFSLNQMNQHVDKGIGTDQIVKIIENILQAQKPKARYKVGAPLQKLSGILKTLLPSRIFEKLLMNHYKL
jgi:NAD(P)-dependent dehydrogenase (short-subunit alcohol dehydrogenase family)